MKTKLDAYKAGVIIPQVYGWQHSLACTLHPHPFAVTWHLCPCRLPLAASFAASLPPPPCLSLNRTFSAPYSIVLALFLNAVIKIPGPKQPKEERVYLSHNSRVLTVGEVKAAGA